MGLDRRFDKGKGGSSGQYGQKKWSDKYRQSGPSSSSSSTYRSKFNKGSSAPGTSFVQFDVEEVQRNKVERMYDQALADDAMDKKFGYERLDGGGERVGWLINMQPTVYRDPESNQIKSAVDFYFLQEDGGRFKASLPYSPYFLISVKPDYETELEQYLRRKYESTLTVVERVEKEDLDLRNHLVGLKNPYLKLSFHNVQDLLTVRSKILPAVKKNKARKTGDDESELKVRVSNPDDILDFITDIREYDVPYHMRVAIDNKINVAKWYGVRANGVNTRIVEKDLLISPDPIVLAWDIETTKLPLKFPNMETDAIIMISYMINGRGYLVTNREIMSEDISDFEYTPKPEFEGPFEIFNEANELAMLRRFYDHILEVKPHVFVTYNGDNFDWPFLERRSEILGINMFKEIGYRNNGQEEYASRCSSHLDCLRWVKRDSYLPVGSHGLKAVTKAKLRYDPVEVHYEEICRMATEEPQKLADYSVSDAVATYYLYMKYVHPFIFALCTIIPLGPDDVLRKGSGTLCESLLMYNAFHSNIVMPNKQETALDKMHDGHLLESETYIGGHVEAIESGVFRSDIPTPFKIVPSAINALIDDLDNALRYTVEVENKRDFSTITNYEEEKQKIIEKLERLRDHPNIVEEPLIYHLDVAAMYPNIILTNRLQPPAIVGEATCAACDFNRPESECQRRMDWAWRGDFSPATRNEYEMIKHQLESEMFPGENGPRAFHMLPAEEQASLIKKRLGLYTRKVYKKTHVTKVEARKSTVCQRENPFYVDTVRNFRDRRYVYKDKLKQTKKDFGIAEKSGDPAEIKRVANLLVLYDSLQLAHKCILNSFYGYVMRKGARWYSMEMAGIVCLTGSNIIKRAREIVEQIGRPLELDTDGIWCMLPGSFPEEISFKTSDGKGIKISYPGAMLNIMVSKYFTNSQYQTLDNPETLHYSKETVNSIFFEVDGPYKAMILPASKEQNKKLKKRYAVFDLDGSLAELKGFEVKRRGELNLIKIFQSEVFETFLQGTTLTEVYDAASNVANHWLDVLFSKGVDLTDFELFDLISENRSMSRQLSDYGAQKSTSISTAKRLAEFLGDDMVKDKGLACQFVISKRPVEAPVTERAIPVAIFSAEDAVKRHYLNKWLKLTNQAEFSYDIRDVLDWDYYVERLGSTIQKIITIPAAMQKVQNPVPRVAHPDWLQKRLVEKKDPFKQQKLSEMFGMKASSSTTRHKEGGKRAKVANDDEDSDDDGADLDALNFDGGFDGGEGQDDDSEDEAPHGGVPDIEDQLGGASKKLAKVTVHRKASPSTSPSHVQDGGDDADDAGSEAVPPPEPERPKVCPPMDQPEEWLDYQKQKWINQRKARKERKLAGVSTSGPRGTLGSYFSRQLMTLRRHHWEILQVASSDTPGVFRVWCVANGDLHCMKVEVPRVFYVNLRTHDSKRPAIVKTLPRAHPLLYLVECSIPEQKFIDEQKNLINYFASRDVQAVYELQVPLIWRLLLELGCVCAVNEKVALARPSASETFKLSELEFKTTKTCPYLPQGLAPFHKLTLFHLQSGQRGIYALYFSKTQSVRVFVMDPAKNALAFPKLTSLWKEAYAARIAEGPDSPLLPPESLHFEHTVYPTPQLACKAVAGTIADYISSRPGPSIALVQSVSGLETLLSLFPSLNDLPLIEAPLLGRDAPLQAFAWQRDVAKSLMQQIAINDEWLQNQVDLARYAHVPLGNLPADAPSFICDVFYARALKRANFVLWATPSPRPDFGGFEEDDNVLISLQSEDNLPEINSPGFYRNFCVEIEVRGLVINTILHSTRLSEHEGVVATLDALPMTLFGDMLENNQGAAAMLSSLDETAQCTQAFRVLKSVVHAWLHEVAKHRNVFADTQLVHFFRWLKHRGALLYDPGLVRFVHGLMKKMFNQLISEFKRLGSQIVSATYSTITLSTEKTNYSDAVKYVDYILGCIKSKDLFSSIDLEPSKFWDHLLWMDRANYAGIEGKPEPTPKKNVRSRDDESSESRPREDSPSEGEESNHDQEEVLASQEIIPEEQSLKVEIETKWNIILYLPEGAKGLFGNLIANWIFRSYEAKQAQRADRGGIGATPVRARLAPGSSEDERAAMLSQLIIESKLMKSMTLYFEANPGDSAVKHSSDFPRLPGSHLTMNNPALETVKMLCHVLSLDSSISDAVDKLRKNLLMIVKVREFSPEATFHNPCMSFVVPEVICLYCNSIRSIDLCRDLDILNSEIWSCDLCHNEYDKAAIESYIILHVQHRVMAYQLQDLVCRKCKMVKADNISKSCSCGGMFKASVPPDSLTSSLRTIFSIATYHRLAQLEDVVSWLIQSNGIPLPERTERGSLHLPESE